jgi:DnaJ-class molecular chaperone
MMPDGPSHPGDEAASGTPQSGDALCPRCSGTGKWQDHECEVCGGTGKVIQLVGGAWRLAT